jgi:hypothetical protein
MIDHQITSKLKNLYENDINWRSIVEFNEVNNSEWEEFIQVGNDFFLADFNRDLIHGIFPADKDIMLAVKHFSDIPAAPITESINQTNISIKTQSCFFDIFLIKKIYLTWLTKVIYPILEKISINDYQNEVVKLNELVFKIEKDLLGMVYYAIPKDLDKTDTQLDTSILTKYSRNSFVNMQIHIMDMIFILEDIDINFKKDIDSIFNDAYLDLGVRLGIVEM